MNYNKEHILWFPPEYQATCFDIRRDNIIPGHANGRGRITFLKFNLAEFRQSNPHFLSL